MPRFPPLDLFIEVTAADGRRFKWDGNQPDTNRPKNLSFRSKLGEGFSDGSLSLTRRIDLDYPDLSLLNDVTIVGADGDVAYEGRIGGMPRESGEAFSIGVTLTGWMANAADQKFTEIIIDRDLSAWGGVSQGRRALVMASNYNITDGTQHPDVATATAGVTTAWDGAWASPFLPASEAWYDAGPDERVGRIAYSWVIQAGGVDPGNANFAWSVNSASDDKATVVTASGNLRAAGPAAGTFTPTLAHRYAFLSTSYTATGAGIAGGHYGIAWYNLAVYGDHGLPTRVGVVGQPPGVTASDVLRHLVTTYCPKLRPDGIVDTTYVIQHLTFRDPTTPYDAMLQINKYHLWHLGVWEGRILHFRPYDLTDYRWEIRTDDEGTTFTPQGPSVENLFNGINVTYTDLLTGTKNRLLAKDHADLRDTSPLNEFNAHGITHHDELELSSPTFEEQAMQIGRATLATRTTPKTPGTITVKGHIRDRHGHWQPVWKIRAGDLISVTNFPNDTPRLIHDATYDDDSKTATLAIDAPAATLDAYMDRLANALQTRGLS